ncbi:hypothetical protein D3C84_1025960 [compost metagenome]
MRPFLAQHLPAWGDAGATDQAVQAAKVVECGTHGPLRRGIVRDIGLDEARPVAEIGHEGLASLGIEVRQYHPATVGDDHACGGGT